MVYREYPRPIPVEFFNSVHGYHKAMAVGVRETPLPDGKLLIEFLVTLEDGEPAIIWQRDVLPL